MLESLSLPEGVSLTRRTAEFTVDTVPDGLLRAHRIAEGVWGLVSVLDGALVFVLEATGESRRVAAGERQVVEPATPHHVEMEPEARFVVEFYR
jgi:tellurite resistance-related uncharacterized protein